MSTNLSSAAVVIGALRVKYQPMMFDETLVELLHTDATLFKDIMLDSLKCFVMKKMSIFSSSTQISELVYVPRHNI